MLSSGGSLSSTPDDTLFQRMDNSQMQVKPQNSASSRILDIPCRVCGDFSSGKHYNIFACDGCAGFFKRSIRRDRKYTCKAKDVGSCVIDKIHRNQCRACRLKRCEEAGMNKDAVQHERGPRNSTLKKQQLTYITEANARLMLAAPQSNVLNLTMGRTPSPPQNPPRTMESVLHLIPHPSFFYHSPPLSRFATPPTLPPTPPMFPQPSTSPSEDSTLPVVCESAARMLFLNVQWMRTVPAYVTLPMQDQVQLLEHAWRDMFVLSIAQCLPLLDLTGPYFSRRITNPVVLREARDFQEIVNKLKQMLLDPHEYQLLRHVILFRATTNLEDRFNRPELNNLLERTRILQLQDEHLTNLNNYIMSAHKEQPMRFTKLMMILPHMKRVTDFLIEELFFRKTIGPIPITNIMCDMYRNHVLGLPMI